MILRLYAAMAEAAGTDTVACDAVGTVADVRAHVAALGQEPARIVRQCSVFRGGVLLADDALVSGEDALDILPPFAGG